MSLVRYRFVSSVGGRLKANHCHSRPPAFQAPRGPRMCLIWLLVCPWPDNPSPMPPAVPMLFRLILPKTTRRISGGAPSMFGAAYCAHAPSKSRSEPNHLASGEIHWPKSDLAGRPRGCQFRWEDQLNFGLNVVIVPEYPHNPRRPGRKPRQSEQSAARTVNLPRGGR